MANLFSKLTEIAVSNGIKENVTEKRTNDIYTETAINAWIEKKGKTEDYKNLIGKERKRFLSNVRSEIRDYVFNCFIYPLTTAKNKEQFEKRYKDFSTLFGSVYREKNVTFSVYNRITSDNYLILLDKAKKQFEKFSK